MENINLGGTNAGATGDGQAANPGANNGPGKPEDNKNPSSISINFTPVTPPADKLASKPVATPAQQQDGVKVMSMEIKRADLKEEDHSASSPANTTPTPEKKGLLSGLFGKKETTPVQAKPSTAWGGALDVPKETKSPEPNKPAAAPASMPIVGTPSAAAQSIQTSTQKSAEQVEFFTSAALQEKAGGSKLMENITTQKAQLEKPKMEDLLGKKSTILEKTIEQESQLKMKKKLRLMQFMSFFLAVVALGVNGYLYYQLSPGVDLLGYAQYNFESNLRNDLFNLNQSLKSVQTELNKYRFLSGQLYLNQFGYESTRFVDGIADLETPGLASQKTEVQSLVTEAKNRMPTLLAGAKQNLTQPIVVETYQTRGEEKIDPLLIEGEFQRELRQAISNEKKALLDASEESNLEVPVAALAFFDNTAKLVGNAKLLTNLNARTIDAFKIEADQYEQTNDPAQRASFRNYIDDLLASTKVNLATITNLRNSRVKWSEVIDRIEKITNQVNSEHNSGLGSANASQIQYASFDFNAETGRVSLSGLNTTQSGTNREVVTYLLEAFEASPEFKNVSNRSFPLSKSNTLGGADVYSLNFKIDMEIEQGAFSKLNTPIADLAEKVAAVVKIPVKRNK